MAYLLDFKFPFAGGPAFYQGLQTFVRTATGSGTGSASNTQSLIVKRTATGSGTGTSTAATKEILPRTATGSGAATAGSSATGLRIARRAGLLSAGVGSGTASFIRVKVRTATGSGAGTSVLSEIMVAIRTATGSGTGTQTCVGARTRIRTATGSGTGSATNTQNKVMFFRPPTDNLVRWADYGGFGLANRLFRFYAPGARGRNVYKLIDGSFTENEQRDMSSVDIIYYGGHNNPVTQDEKDDLVAAGYGAYIT